MSEYSGRTRKLVRFLIPAVLLGTFLVSLWIGKYRIDLQRLISGIGADRRVFVNLRLGRTGAVFFSGIVLGMSGYVFQTVFRNPLAAPDVAGVASGASVGAAAAILLFSGSGIWTAPFAFETGMLAVALVMVLHRFTERFGIASLVVCGICVNALFQAILSLLKLAADSEHIVASMEFWLMGSFANVTMSKFLNILPPMCIGAAGLLLFDRPVSLLAFGDDEAEMMGVNVRRMRPAALVLATVCVSSVISAAGLISFIGLIAPHIARMIPGRKNMLRMSGAVGCELLMVSDLLARTLLVNEIPVSVMTSLIGVPVLFILMVRRKKAT